MLFSKYRQAWLIAFSLGICPYFSLYSQSAISPEFLIETYKSVKNLEPYQSAHYSIFKTFLTFHPVSVANDTVSMYVFSNLLLEDSGKLNLGQGRLVRIPTRILPSDPLQLLVLPMVISVNYSNLAQREVEFTQTELDTWKACGYLVQPTEYIGTTRQDN